MMIEISRTDCLLVWYGIAICLFCDVHNRFLFGGLCCQHCISLYSGISHGGVCVPPV